MTFEKDFTALIVIDPYNDFISEGGKIWNRIKAVAEANNCVPNMLQVLTAARKAKLRVFYAMHHRYRQGDYETCKYIAPIQKAGWRSKVFEHGTWGGEIRSGFEPQAGDIVAQEHWCSSGFATTFPTGRAYRLMAGCAPERTAGGPTRPPRQQPPSPPGASCRRCRTGRSAAPAAG